MSSFRASPWVTYEPSIPSRTRQQPASDSDMDEDIEMDAPQISTLREEDSPPPQPTKKNIIHIKKRPASTTLTHPSSDKAPVGNNEEEDQLIDELIDDDDDLAKPSSSSQQVAGRSSDSPQKRKVSAKRKPRKNEKRLGDGEKKIKENLNVSQPTGAHILAPTMSWFKANLSESHEETEIAHSSPLIQPSEPPVTKGKKVSPRKPANVPRAKAKLAKYAFLTQHFPSLIEVTRQAKICDTASTP
jgi:Wiskott-Aldrich syndrome protein